MARSIRQRALPSTPRTGRDDAPGEDRSPEFEARPRAGDPTPGGAAGSDSAHEGRSGGGGADDPQDRAAGNHPDPLLRYESEPAYLVRGTNCLAGHEPGEEFDAGRIGELPSSRTTWLGVGLVAWCMLGLAFIVDIKWLSLGQQVLVLWLVFSALVQRRMGHRGKCWRTRAWRHAWGGFVPRTGDPTHPAGEHD